MHRTITLVAALATAPVLAQANVYQCTRDGVPSFSDRPCGPSSQTVEITTTRIGGRLDTGTDIEIHEPDDRRQRKTSEQGCAAGYIQSTRLRHLRVKERVETGMSAEQVRYILGAPHHRDGQWWVYEERSRETGRYELEGGCLVDIK